MSDIIPKGKRHVTEDDIDYFKLYVKTMKENKQLRAKLEAAESAIAETKFFLETVIENKSQYSFPVGDDGYRLMANGKRHAKDLLKRLDDDFPSKQLRDGG
jgi:hypothetical protein